MSAELSTGRRYGELLLGVTATTLMVWQFGQMESAWSWIGWVALVPWLAVLDRARTVRQALVAGLLQSLLYTAAITGWFAGALRDYAHSSASWAYWLVLLLFAPILQPQFITAAVARHLAGRWAPAGAFLRVGLTGALVYVGTEWLWPKLFVDTMGHGFYGSIWWRQGADVAGAHGLTAVLIVVNECVLAAVKAFAARGWKWPGFGPLRTPAAVAVALVVALTGYGAWRYQQVSERMGKGEGLKVGVVQASITNYGKLREELGTVDALQMILDTHYALSDGLMKDTKPDLIVWPETVYPTTFGSPKSEEGAQFDQQLSGYVGERQVPLIFGAYDLEQDREFNAAMFLGPVGSVEERRLELAVYRKNKLFPLTEYVPEVMDKPWVRGLLPWLGTWKRGEGPQTVPFALSGGRVVKVAPLICYEDVYPGFVAEAVRQGAELIVTISNDSWFGPSMGPRLHVSLSAFRSIETRLPQVRATNSGISAFISPTGEILNTVQTGQRAGVLMAVPQTKPVGTLMVAWGDWFGPTALVLSAVLLVAQALLARRGRLAKPS